MSVLCNINLNKPPEAVYLPGETISGIIRYTLREPMETERIIISLKGMGFLKLIYRDNSNDNRSNRTYIRDELYVDYDAIIHEGNWTVPPGDYEARFNFQLPQNIPPSLTYSGTRRPYTVYTYIKYYVRIKFERSGLFSFSKHFRKKIIVASSVTPSLPMEPYVHTKSHNLFNFFSSKIRTIHLKGNILTSVIPHGGKIQIQCDIHNDTDLDLNWVEVNLTQVYKFKIIQNYKEIRFFDDVKPCYNKTQAIERGAKHKVLFEFDVPFGCVSLEHSDLVSREYIVTIIAKVPMPHRNVKLSIPVQIGDNMVFRHQEVGEAPPTYWEAMGEGEKDDDDEKE
ncbi:uncharacterized protein LOC111348229 [Spodoptera litura]|uniref:Uncharacterized protein LOC111348229 n=1 Tax=Spodoptera litura TaxID=69820 RepID=A0A9J7DNQ0_SPOLT|nr:uncharacterized protein LOC111348229 [Spodoptera litura]